MKNEIDFLKSQISCNKIEILQRKVNKKYYPNENHKSAFIVIKLLKNFNKELETV